MLHRVDQDGNCVRCVARQAGKNVTGYPSHAPGCSKEAGPALNLTSSQPTQQPNAAEVGIAAEVGNAPRDPASASAPTGSDAVVDVEMTAGISDAGSPDAAGHGAVHGPNPALFY